MGLFEVTADAMAAPGGPVVGTVLSDGARMQRREFLFALGAGIAGVTRADVGCAQRDDTAELQRRLDAATEGATIVLPARELAYVLNAPLRVRRAGVTVRGDGVVLRQPTAGRPGIVVEAHGVTLDGLTLDGPGSTGRDDGFVGVLCTGTTESSWKRLRLRRLHVAGWSHAVRLAFVDAFDVDGCTLRDLGYAGVMLESCRRGRVSRNRIERVLGEPNAYGIAVTRRGGCEDCHPPSRDVAVFENVVHGVPHWSGLDTHAGIDVEFRDNVLRDVRIGVGLGPSEGLVPVRCRALRNEIHAGTASPQVGAEITGLPSAPAVDCVIADNLVEGFGTLGSPFGAAVRVQWADRPVVRHNTILRSLQAAIALFGTVREASVERNVIAGIDATAGPFIAAVKIPDGQVTGHIVGNRIDAGIAAGIRARTPQRVEVRDNTIVTTGRRYHPSPSYFAGLPR